MNCFWLPSHTKRIWVPHSSESAQLMFAIVPPSGGIVVSDASSFDDDGGARVLLLSPHGEANPNGGVTTRVVRTWDYESMDDRGFRGCGLAVAEGGLSIFVVRMDSSSIHELSLADGAQIRQAPPPTATGWSAAGENWSLNFPLGCALSDSGKLFVVDSDHHRIAVYDPSAFKPPSTDWRSCVLSASGRGAPALLYVFGGGRRGKPGREPGRLKDPFDVAARDGHVYVTDSANHRISVFTEEGLFVRCLGSSPRRSGARRMLTDPSGLDFLPDGRLVVATSGGQLSFWKLSSREACRLTLTLNLALTLTLTQVSSLSGRLPRTLSSREVHQEASGCASGFSSALSARARHLGWQACVWTRPHPPDRAS